MIIVRNPMSDFPIKDILNLMNTLADDPLVTSFIGDGGESANKPSLVKIPAPGVSKDQVKVKKAVDSLYVYVKDTLLRTISIKPEIKPDSIKVQVKDGLITIGIDYSGSMEEIPVN